jgi:hypothetical protein
MDIAELGLGGMDWTGLARDQYRWRVFVNAVMNLQVNAQVMASTAALSYRELVS